jgi:predicted MFS family arabinose efflux permease
MLLFSAASFAIAFTDNLQVVYALRIVQGFTSAVIIVGKRAFFVDIYRGDQLKKYTSLFSVIWAIAPIVAPFLGGFFQTTWGWKSNFIFLGFLSLVFFFIELSIGGETMKTPQPFKVKTLLNAYGTMLKTPDFTSGMVILGLTYGMVLLYGMCSPFLIEHQLHFSPVATGYCALFSGVSVMIGGSVSRMLIKKPFTQKLVIAASLQMVTLGVMIPLTMYYQNLFTLLVYVFLLHSTGGFIFNNLMSYCLIRFPQYAGKASGLTGGGFSVVTSILSSLLVSSIKIETQALLGVGYAVSVILVFALIIKTAWKGEEEKKAVHSTPSTVQSLAS